MKEIIPANKLRRSVANYSPSITTNTLGYSDFGNQRHSLVYPAKKSSALPRSKVNTSVRLDFRKTKNPTFDRDSGRTSVLGPFQAQGAINNINPNMSVGDSYFAPDRDQKSIMDYVRQRTD